MERTSAATPSGMGTRPETRFSSARSRRSQLWRVASAELWDFRGTAGRVREAAPRRGREASFYQGAYGSGQKLDVCFGAEERVIRRAGRQFAPERHIEVYHM